MAGNSVGPDLGRRLRVSRLVAGAMGIALVFGVSACRGGQSEAGRPEPTRLRLATTTSTENSGLLDELLPAFMAAHGVDVQVLSVGTGRALKLGASGDVDAVLVHAREAEDRFIAEGHGVNRRDVMYNDFVLVGPPADPAQVADAEDVADAFRRISDHGAFFISRGDDSGTHKKELAIWAAAGIDPESDSYVSAGRGMGAVLVMAYEKRAYTLVDRGTYLAFQDRIDVSVLHEGDAALRNPYGVIAVNPKEHPEANYGGAMAFIEWVTSEEGQTLIGGFHRHGQALFHPAEADAESGQDRP